MSSVLTTRKRLIAFDFDHTIADKNTDLVVRDLMDATKIPESTKTLYKSNGWIPYMHEIFGILHKNGVTKKEILDAVYDIPEVPGIKNCLRTLNDNNFDIVIISDSNSEFITHWNRRNDISKYFAEIFTNPAFFEENGRLCVGPHHTQTECSISSTNLCKGNVLESFIKRKRNTELIEYENVFMVGDGYHDICPMLRLEKTDFACPRLNYAADTKLGNTAEKISTNVRAMVLKWVDGDDLLNQIKRNLNGF